MHDMYAWVSLTESYKLRTPETSGHNTFLVYFIASRDRYRFDIDYSKESSKEAGRQINE